MLQSVFFRGAFSACKNAEAIAIAGNTGAGPFFFLPVAFAAGVLSLDHVDVAPGVQADVAPGTDAAAYQVDVAFGLQGGVTFSIDLAAHAGTALRFTSSLFRRRDRYRSRPLHIAKFLFVFLATAVGGVICRNQV